MDFGCVVGAQFGVEIKMITGGELISFRPCPWQKMDPLAPRPGGSRRHRLSQVSDEPQHRTPTADVEARIAAAIAQRESLHGGSALQECDGAATTTTTDSKCYEYLDHTADIQLHAWGDSFASALEHVLAAMFGYMTDLDTIEAIETVDSFVVRGHDRTSLVFSVMQEWLGQFHETGFIPSVVTVEDIAENVDEDGGNSAFTARSHGKGERFDASKHTSGTEVKAVTFSNLQAVQRELDRRWDIWVIVDI